MAIERHLIVNADDLGLCERVNVGIFLAHELGVVTSASLMVRWPAAVAAARCAAAHPNLAIGLHLDIAQWEYADGEWSASYARCDTADAAAVRRECRAQLEAFRELLGRDPTHLDSHQHVHESEPVASVAGELVAELAIPLRGARIRYEGGFYGQTGKGEPFPDGITSARLAAIVAELPPGWTELGCHPGLAVDGESSYRAEREGELQTLCDPAVRSAVREAGVRLRSFAELPRMN